MDRLEGIEIFIQVSATGSFSAVARTRGLSPTMVSKHIQALEERLGVRLIQRTTRRQSLTDAGRRYLERAERLLAHWSEAETSVQSLRSSPKGTLRVSCPVTFGTERLSPVIADYLQSYPDVQVELFLSDRPPALPEDGVDAAFWIGALHDSELIAHPLLPYRMCLCASPAYLKKRGAPRRPDDLKAHACLGFAFWDRKDRWKLKGPKGEVSVTVRGSFTANNGRALKKAALAGAGILLQPEALVAADLERGLLVRVLPGYEPAHRAMHLLHAADRQPTPALRTFVDFVLKHFGRRSGTAA